MTTNTNKIFAYQWTTEYEDDDTARKTHIRIYGIALDDQNKQHPTGRARRGPQTVCLRTTFTPYAYIELPDDDKDLVSFIEAAIKRHTQYTEVMYKTHLYNSSNTTTARTGGAPFLFCQCATKQAILEITYMLKTGVMIPGRGKICLRVHETQAAPILQMASLRKIPMAGWILFKNADLQTGERKITCCDLEYKVRWKQLFKCEFEGEPPAVVPKTIAFDLEVNSVNTGQLPSDRPGDAIFQISCVVAAEGGREKHLFTLSANDGPLALSGPGISVSLGRPEGLLDGVVVHVYEAEEELLKGFIDFVSEERPNVLTGYNIFGFDIEYLMKRCIRFCLSTELKSLSFNKQSMAKIETVKWSSSAYKNQEFKFLNWEGILLLDLLPLIQRDYKLDTYSLKNVTHVFLNNDTKDPVSYKDVFEAYRTREREKLEVVGKYCVQDSNLCIELMNHLHCWTALSEMAKVCNVSMFTLYTQGQQIKTFSQVYKHCLERNIVVDTDGYVTKGSDRYTGAYVFEPVPGYYNRVCPLDWSSLYPSIMISENICPSTLAPDCEPDENCNIFEWEDHIGCEHDPRVIKKNELNQQIAVIETRIKELMKKRDGITSKTVVHGIKVKDAKARIQQQINREREKQRPYQKERSELTKAKPADREDEEGNKISGVICAKRYYRFLKAGVKKGVIPTIIQDLLDSRNRVKKLMKAASPAQRLVYDKEQLAYKISANSMYGAMGVRKGYLPFMPGAMCITYAGRKSIERTAQLIVENWGGKLVYGDTDSNYVIFPQKETIQETWDYAIEVAAAVSKEFPPPMKLEFEGTIYERFLILSKKRYMYQETDRAGNLSKKIGKKGVILARRDNSGMMRKIYEKTAHMIFDRVPAPEIEYAIIEYISDMFRNVIDYQDYVITKSVGDTEGDGSTLLSSTARLGDYKIRQKLPDSCEERNSVLRGKSEKEFYISQCPAHIQLAERMRNRGIPVSAGSRIEYVVVKHYSKNATLGERLEDFDTFKQNTWVKKIDTEYYLNSLINALDQMLDVGIKNNHFVSDQYKIRMQFEKVVKEIKKLGRPKFVKKQT